MSNNNTTKSKLGARYPTTPRALTPFLEFLEQDITRHPERLRPLDAEAIERAQELTEGMVVDLDAPLGDGEE